ncbi:MAG: helix-turn-helix transcriptional regulator [Firmicutes bacterium]|nr:helix-turn-helix transcriptional regulator [Bacillota bacterium]
MKERGDEVNIYGNIKRLCEMKGVNIRNLEKSIGMGNGVIGRWRIYEPKISGIKKVANYFGVPIEELLKDDETE